MVGAAVVMGLLLANRSVKGLRCSIDLAGVPANEPAQRRGDGRRGYLSRLLAPHPLQVRAGYNQLQPLLVTMTDGELLHARRQDPTRGAAPHAVRAWLCPLLYLQVREFSGEATIVTVLCLKVLNLLLAFFPVHSAFLGVGEIRELK
jgi:hypothetical protein